MGATLIKPSQRYDPWLGVVVQTFPSNRPWKEVSKTGFKILGPTQKICGGQSQ